MMCYTILMEPRKNSIVEEIVKGADPPRNFAKKIVFLHVKNCLYFRVVQCLQFHTHFIFFLQSKQFWSYGASKQSANSEYLSFRLRFRYCFFSPKITERRHFYHHKNHIFCPIAMKFGTHLADMYIWSIFQDKSCCLNNNCVMIFLSMKFQYDLFADFDP